MRKLMWFVIGFAAGCLLLAELGWIYTDKQVITSQYLSPEAGGSGETVFLIHRNWIFTGWGMHNNIGGGGLENPAKTAHASVQAYEVDYATHYNWLFFNHLQVRVGGSLNIYGDFMQNHEHAINNVMTINLQTQLYALAEVRYGMDFKRFGIDIYANIGTPFIGFSSFDDRYEPFITSVIPGEINVKAYNHFKFTSFHNMQGLNFEIGVDFALRDLTLSFSYEERDRWWNGFELQNYRKNSLLKVGISVNLFPVISPHRYAKLSPKLIIVSHNRS